MSLTYRLVRTHVQHAVVWHLHRLLMLDVALACQEQLDLKLQQRQARETGICPIREELYAQCFGA